jgi:hypothetical protein
VKRALCAAVTAVVVVMFCGLAAPRASASAAPQSDTLPETPRVLVISLPGVTWKDIAENDLPNLRSVIDGSAVANLAVRVTHLKTPVGDGYATIGAGTRAVGPKTVSGEAFEPREKLEADDAAAVYERQHGHPLRGAAAHLQATAIKNANRHTLYKATVAALGDALAKEGVQRGVVANADAVPPLPDLSTFHREAVLALMGSDGQVPCGTVGTELLMHDSRAAFGVALDPAAVEQAMVRCWQRRSVVLVEGSDLPRTESYASTVSGARLRVMWRAALVRTDQLVGRLLRHVDPARDAVVLVAPSALQIGAPHLTMFAVRAPGLRAGLLDSGVTRQAGFVSLVDVAPTIAALVGAPLDDKNIEGRPVSVARGGGDAAQRIDFLVTADENAGFRDGVITPFTWTFVVIVLLLGCAAAVCLWFGRSWWALEPVALGLIATPPLTYWAALLPFRDWPTAAYYAFTFGLGLVIGSALSLIRRRGYLPLVVVLSFMLATIAISVVALDSRLQLSTVFGDSPVVAGRFSGVNNVTFSQLMIAGLLLAVFVARLRPRIRLAAVAALFVAVALVDGAPMWGADVGGVLAGLPAFGLAFTLLAGWRVRLRAVVWWGLGTIGTVVVLGLLDLTRDPSHRTHLGRLFERIGDTGSGGLTTVITRKLDANLATLSHSVWRLTIVPIGLLALYVAWRTPERLEALRARLPALTACLIGIAVAAVLGYALNDSGIAVPGVMLSIWMPAMVFLLIRTPAPPESRGLLESLPAGKEDDREHCDDGSGDDERDPSVSVPGEARPYAGHE